LQLHKSILAAIVLSLTVSSVSFAHSGRTDGNGGHNCSATSQAKGLCSGYHYHNGGSSSNGSSSGSSNSTPKASEPAPKPAPAPAPPKEVIPAGHVKVIKPSYDVFVNGQSVPNHSIQYPVISYKDITYFPMTYKFTQALGIETAWDAKTGFVVRKTESPAGTLEFDYGAATNFYAKQPDFNVFVNDVWVDNSSETYPVLVLNDITYFPMTWHYAVDELGLTIKLENNAFYISK
jgi:hypothetical protein